MDLKIKDVAELLNVSETTIRRWLSAGKIPAYRLNHQYRFSTMEIEEWVMSRKMNRNEEKDLFVQEMVNLQSDKAKKILKNQIGTQAYSLFRAVNKGGVIQNVSGNTKEKVIRESIKIIAQNLGLDADIVTELLLDRENLMPTGLNHGIAVPHTRDFLIPKPFDVVCVVYPERPIEYGSLDGKKVHTLFFLFACGDKRHLHLLAKLAHLTREEESLSFLTGRPEKKQLLDYIKNWEGKIRSPMKVTV